MAPRKVNKTNPRNVAKPVSQLRGAAKQARISRVTKAEAGPATIRGGMAPGAGRSKPVGTGGGGVTKPSGTPKMVNADKPTMRQIQAKADALRQRTQNPTPRGRGQAVRMPSSSKQGVNLPRTGAKVLRQQAAGTPSPAAQARAKAQGQALRSAAETRRAARAASKRMEGVLKAAKTARQIAGAAGALTRGGVAAAVLAPRPAGDGTLTAAMKRGDYKPMQGPKPSTTQASFNKKTFDQAFKAARTSGAKQFTWRGKKYTTKIKGE